MAYAYENNPKFWMTWMLCYGKPFWVTKTSMSISSCMFHKDPNVHINSVPG